ncbi:MAG: UDP-N-acetylglucosamine 2-epimerase [Burkholderiales bacterium]
MARRKICVVTGSRAEYGLLYWLMKEIREDADLELQVIATGMHLSPEFGLTYRAIEEDGFSIDAKVEMLLSSDTSVGVAKSMGLGTIGFADAFERLSPDIVVLLGDRFEILSAAQAALVMRIPVAHISGGEITEGAMDDSIRHAITKMSHFHFVAAEAYRKRVIQMGEEPGRVINTGDPGLDNIRRLNLLERTELGRQIGFDLSDPFFLVTYHPVTLSDVDPIVSMKALCDALDHFPDYKVIFTKPNADMGGREIAASVDAYAATNQEKVYACQSLGQIRYLSAMRHCTAVIGNSSSGIVEAPGMKKPTVNIGDRQNGRLKADSIIDCPEEKEAIVEAIELAISPAFRTRAEQVVSLYGDSNASTRIKAFLKEADYAACMQKRFHDLP